MPAAAIGAGIGGLGSLAGGIMGANAAGDAAEGAQRAAQDSNAMQWNMFQQGRADQDPFRGAGIQALYGNGGLFKRVDGGSGMAQKPIDTKARDAWVEGKVGEFSRTFDAIPDFGGAKAQALANAGDIRARYQAEWDKSHPMSKENIDTTQYQVDPELTRNFQASDFQKDPGYDFRLQEGQKALERSAAARGNLFSGQTLAGVGKYGQDYASGEYQNAYNRFNADRDRRFSRLSGLAGMGQGAANNISAMGQNYANQYGQNVQGAANARGAAGIQSANAWGGALSGIGGAINGYAAGQQQQQWMDKWLAGRNGASVPSGYDQAKASNGDYMIEAMGGK